ncbi:MAG: sodium:solute symporter family protein [Bacillota bacterium]
MDVRTWTWVFFGLFMVALFFMAYRGMLRTRTAVDYSTAPRSYGPAVIGIALMATACSAAATMGNPGLVHANGWPALWYAMGGYMGIATAWASSAFLLARIGKNAGAKSMPDFMGIRFNSPVLRVVTALACIAMMYYIAGQFAGLGWVFAEACGLPYVAGVIIGGCIIAAYISVGGTHADILNCFLQGIIMMILAVLVCIPVFMHIGGISAIDQILTARDPLYSSNVVFRNPMFGPFTGPAIFVSLGLFGLTPQLSKLWLALDDEKHVPHTLLWGFFALAFMAMIMWVGGLGGEVLFPNVKSDTATVNILINYWPPVVAALGMVGILAAVMSTSAGLFLVVAIAIAIDIYQDTIVPLQKNPPPRDVLDKRVLLMQRILVPLVMIVGILLAHKPPPFLTALMWMGIGLFTGSVIPPMVVGSLWKRTTRIAAEVASIAGFVLFLILVFVFGVGMGIPFFKVPWACAGISTIVSTVLVIGLSFVTRPMDTEYVERLFART